MTCDGSSSLYFFAISLGMIRVQEQWPVNQVFVISLFSISTIEHINWVTHKHNSNLEYAKKEMSSKKGYVPDDLVSNYMREKLHFEKKRKEEKLQGRELSEDSKYLNLKKRKADVLRRIFTSMANLTFFFECIAENEEIKRVFEDDILDLFGLRRNTPELNRPGYMFSRLMSSILIGGKLSELKLEDLLEREKVQTNDFSLVLTDLLQQAVNDKVSITLPAIIDEVPDARTNVLSFFNAARGWTKMLEHLVDLDMLSEAPHRTFNFDTSKLLSKKVRT